MGTRKSKAKQPSLKPSKPSEEQARSMTVGEQLRRARERSGASINEVAEQLCLSVTFLLALEEDDYAKLPEPIYVRGYIRSYARLLSLPADGLVEKFNEVQGGGSDATQEVELISPSNDRPSFKKKVSPTRARLITYLVTIIVAGLIVLLSLSYWSKSDHSGSPGTGLEKVSIEGADGRPIFEDFSSVGGEISPIVQQLVQEPLLETEGFEEGSVDKKTEPAEGTSFSSFIDSLFVSAQEECWVKVTDGSGGTLHAALLSPGESLSLSGLAPFKVVVGNVQGVSLNFNGEHVNLDSYQRSQSRVAVVKLGG